MISSIVAIYDKKAEAFLKPVVVQSHPAAVRSFGDAVNDPTTEFYKHCEDFAIFAIGEFDDLTGTLIPREKGNIMLAEALALRKNDDLQPSLKEPPNV